MFIDTHGHVNFNAFKEDAQAVLSRALEKDTWVILPGSQYSTSRRAVEIAERYEKGVYAAIGLHPIHLGERRKVDEFELQSGMTPALHRGSGEARFSGAGFETQGEEFSYEKYKELGESKKVVAIGECGLDYYYEAKSKEKREAQRRKQKATLAAQVRLAQELNLPVIFHCRKAHNDLITFLSAYKLQSTNYKLQGVVHCYTGDLKQAERFYNLGLYFGFNGLIFKDVPALPNPKEIIASIPLERIVLETDSPYLAPSKALAKEGMHTERNEPLFVKYIAEEIARIKGVSIDEVASVTTANAKALFSLA